MFNIHVLTRIYVYIYSIYKCCMYKEAIIPTASLPQSGMATENVQPQKRK